MVRVRFAPSPTGDLHLGNIRAALINYLFAKKSGGKFVLRIEDTDESRLVEDGIAKIAEDLQWLGLNYDEGPFKEGEFGPYLQSERKNIYQEKLQELIDAQKVYRCFCTPKELKVRRERQLSLGNPPKYDRACLGMSDDMIKQELVEKRTFIWRLKVNEEACLDINTMARGVMRFEFKNIGDFALTRSDSSFTFMFANFVDDWLMGVTHVIRGEDHLSNTAMQGALFDAFAVQLPTFWHLSLLYGVDGKLLSKREFGASLKQLREVGFLPQAICNYLAVSGRSLKEEVCDLVELSDGYNFDNLHATGPIKLDIDKLKWFNHKWINKLDSKELLEYAKPFVGSLDDKTLSYVIDKVKTDIVLLTDLPKILEFYFNAPETDRKTLETEFGLEDTEKVLRIIFDNLTFLDKSDFYLETIKKQAKEMGIKMRPLLATLRYMLTGSFSGLSLHDILDMIDFEESKARVERLR